MVAASVSVTSPCWARCSKTWRTPPSGNCSSQYRSCPLALVEQWRAAHGPVAETAKRASGTHGFDIRHGTRVIQFDQHPGIGAPDRRKNSSKVSPTWPGRRRREPCRTAGLAQLDLDIRTRQARAVRVRSRADCRSRARTGRGIDPWPRRSACRRRLRAAGRQTTYCSVLPPAAARCTRVSTGITRSCRLLPPCAKLRRASSGVEHGRALGEHQVALPHPRSPGPPAPPALRPGGLPRPAKRRAALGIDLAPVGLPAAACVDRAAGSRGPR